MQIFRRGTLTTSAERFSRDSKRVVAKNATVELTVVDRARRTLCGYTRDAANGRRQKQKIG
jgi:hypothetical protein